MQHNLLKVHGVMAYVRTFLSEEALAIILVVLFFTNPAAAAMRMQDRGLYMKSTLPGVTTEYTISFRYMSPDAVGSVDLLFCNSPIPYEPCVTPTGLNVSQTILSGQTGETGYSIASKSANHIVLTRPPTTPSTATASSYTFSGIVNPTNTAQAFSVRIKSLASTNGTGPQIDFGSVRGQVTNAIVLETQVPPMLIFCVAQQVAENCTSTNETNYTDMGQLSDKSTLTAWSQMAIGTNASGGFAVTANGGVPAAGTSVIDSPSNPVTSQKGTNQFGINLVANDAPQVGDDPIGPWTNAVAAPGYNVPNRYKYASGDVVAFSPNVSLMRTFTVSYILNSAANLKAGVYSTTITYIASGRF
ncbi:MAG TPA: hypothetical protein VGE34_03800 [Candidatus Saccharimonadales bacterium]